MVRNVTHQDPAEDYEAQRQANIKANLELMMSLGLYQSSAFLNPKPPTASRPKPSPKPKSSTAVENEDEDGDGEKKVERPKRITRSVSRILDHNPKRTGRGLKRALSDEGSRKTKRFNAEDYNPRFFDDESDDEYQTRRSTNSLNPNRQYRDQSDLQRTADRLGSRIHNPKTFGSIPGIPIGTIFSKRIHASIAAVHAPTVAGISGNEIVGCWSICLSGGYEDDIDLGDVFTYTGSGGRDLKGTVQNPKNLRTAPQSKDQQWEGKNAALQKSVKTGKPVRVMRGWKGRNQWSPREGEGYVYCGLYKVVKAWMEKGKAGFKVCKFRFERLPGQAPLPTFDHHVESDEEVAEVSSTQTQPTAPIRKQTKPASPSPTPSNISIRSTSSTSPHPILKESSNFDRAQYIIISDSDSEDETGEGEEVQLMLEVEHKKVEEKAARRSPRKSSWKPMTFNTSWKAFRS